MIGRLLFVIFFFASFVSSPSAHEGQPHPVPPTIAAPIETTTLKKIGELFSREVLPILRQKCFDCHSSQTQYPWYYRLPIAKQIIDQDIQEGRKHIDMTDGFPFKGHHTVVEQLEALEKMIGKDSMPLWRYRLLHRGSGLTEQEKKAILDWVGSAKRGLLSNGK